MAAWCRGMVHYCRDSRLGVRSGFFGGLGGVYGEEGGIYCFAAVGETHDSADGELHRGKQVWGVMLAVQQQEGISRWVRGRVYGSGLFDYEHNWDLQNEKGDGFGDTHFVETSFETCRLLGWHQRETLLDPVESEEALFASGDGDEFFFWVYFYFYESSSVRVFLWILGKWENQSTRLR